ncbi:hypothetical protein D9M68_530180 [compost metagenome]
MKLLLLLGFFMSLTFFSFAQSKSDSLTHKTEQQTETPVQGGNNELKINALFIALGLPEITYERILSNNRGLGVALVIGTNNEYRIKYAINPFYRWYFGQKKANGFFLEGNMNALYQKESTYDDDKGGLNFSGGIAGGAKFFSRNGIFAEAYLGYNRTLGGARLLGSTYPRMGLTIGKRFH